MFQFSLLAINKEDLGTGYFGKLELKHFHKEVVSHESTYKIQNIA